MHKVEQKLNTLRTDTGHDSDTERTRTGRNVVQTPSASVRII